MANQHDDSGKKSSSSSSSSSRSRFNYHVFLNFRGSDVGYEFADFLYRTLLEAGLRVFRDEEEINMGKEFGKVIEKAIRESKVGIIIFSRDFASSTYCLDEVATLMELRARGEVQVLPVFYKVDPSDVRNLGEAYGKSFKRHAKRFESNKLAAWKDALRQAATLTGLVYQGERSLWQFTRDVAAEARCLADLVMFDLPSHVVGQPYRFSRLERWMRDPSHDNQIALLHGPSGIGKKTIATVVTNQNYGIFEAIAFLEDVSDKFKKPGGIVRLQGQLLSKLTPERLEGEKGIPSELEGMLMIKESLKNKRVLIILADLDHADHFSKLIGKPEFLGKGSKVIVTSGNKNLLHDHSRVKFPVSPLTPAQSLELFSLHAFGTARPAEEYEGRIVAALGPFIGKPSALKAYASLFTPLDTNSWVELLPGKYEDTKSSVNAKNDVIASFDSLEEVDKELFLDIACFYAGWDREHVDSVLNDDKLYKKGGFDRLRTRHLVSVDMNNKVTMSKPIIDVGREIVGQKTEAAEKFSNIWCPEDAYQILSRRIGTKHIRSFIFDGREIDVWEMEFGTEAFAGMTKLKLLQLVNINLKGDFKDFPKELVCFSWDGMSLHRTPDNNNSLKDLDLSLGRLKILDLSHSRMLERTPDFGRLRVPKLERLILEGCSRLVEIHSSIQDLTRLVLLSLKGCASLEELSVVGSPTILDISDCTALRVMPNTRIESVKELRAHQIQVDQLLAESPHLSLNAVFPRLDKSTLVGCQPSDDDEDHDDERITQPRGVILKNLDPRRNLPTSLRNGWTTSSVQTTLQILIGLNVLLFCISCVFLVLLWR